MTKMNQNGRKKVEILAPAGSYESLKAAVCAGADAVYVGGTRFGARAYADNFTEEELLHAIDYVHLHGRKIYMTVNTLLKDEELKGLYDYLLPYYCQGLDAVIVQDVGVLSFLREQFPDLAIHISTQMTVTGSLGAKFFKEQGAERIVPARELSLNEIRVMKEETGLEIECFVHGAMCYCYSGQCLMSSMIGGRSGNRGQCAQPCRLSYSVGQQKNKDLMSLKDLCTIEMIPELIDAGIDSFKIEGRMKQPDYVYTVVKMYRKYTDLYLLAGKEAFRVTEKDKKVLENAYRRRGYSTGYYKQHNGKNMISFQRPQNGSEELLSLPTEKIKEKINGELILSEGDRAKLNLWFGELAVAVEGEIVQKALKQPLDEERIRKQMKKTGDTEVEFEYLNLSVAGDIFLPMQALNELRRTGIKALEDAVVNSFHRDSLTYIGLSEDAKETISRDNDWKLTALVSNPAQLHSVLAAKQIRTVYVEADILFDDRVKREIAGCGEKKIYAALPFICRSDTIKYLESCYRELETLYDGVMIRNFESLMWLRQHGYKKEITGDYNLYVFNKRSRAFLQKNGLDRYTASVELNERELKNLDIRGSIFIAYGYQPVMITANCIQKTTTGCTRKNDVRYMEDRYKNKFTVKNCCKYCYNVIYNPVPLMLLHQAEAVRNLYPAELRLDFVTESEEEMKKIINLYGQTFLEGKTVNIPQIDYTKGHFKRGVK